MHRVDNGVSVLLGDDHVACVVFYCIVISSHSCFLDLGGV